MTVLLLALATAFGAGDQYLGSLSAHPWGADVSLLSAPWLVLPFLAGATRREPRRAAALGLACAAALCLEPLARRAGTSPTRFPAIAAGELGAGVALAVYVLARRLALRRD